MPDEPAAPMSTESFDQRTRFGSFEILPGPDGKPHLLGKGAFGRTYKARHIFLERTVALKIINDKFMTDAKARERFLGEARAAAKLQHPHIAQILDFGETDGLLFYAMEYCSGGDLADYVKRNGPLSVVQTVQIGLQIAAALQCAHGAGFIHRDLKPSNLMLAAPDGPIVTKLIDFGLVIAATDQNSEPVDPDEIPTIEQRFVGTPLFASPEQLMVQPLDSRSDFFALGMTLWFLVIGAAPDPGNSAAVVAARLKPDSYAPRLPGKLPQAFQAVLARLLEKQPENRFANATQLVAALGKCAAGLGLPMAPTSPYRAGLAEEAEAEDAGPPQPADLERIEVAVEECYTLQGERGGSATGADFAATSLTDHSTVWLHFLKPSLLANPRLLERLRKNIGHLQRRPAASLLGVGAFREYPDRTLVVLEAPGGSDLLSFSKAVGPQRLADARTLLQSIANACDALTSVGLPAPELEPHRVFIRLNEAGLPAGAQVIPRLLSPADVATVEPLAPARAETGWQYAALVYRLLAGRNLPVGDPPSAEALAVPGLSEEASRLLTQALASQLVHATCSELLADLLIAEGLMGASVTRTHVTTSATSGPGSTQGHPSTSPAPTTTAPPAARSNPVPPPLPSDAAPQAAALPPVKTADRSPQVSPPSREAPSRTAPRSPSLWPLFVAVILVLAVLGGAGAWLVLKIQQKPAASSGPAPLGGTATLTLQGDLPAHATARVADRGVTLDRSGGSVRASFDATGLQLPAGLFLEAAGFKPIEIPLKEAADLARPHDATMKRAEGVLVFQTPQGSDYVHAAVRMTAQLPDEQSFVELERFNRGIPFSTEPEAPLVTGVYQLTLRGADERVVRPRLVDRIVIKPGERTEVQVPPTFAGRYRGTVVPHQQGKPDGEPVGVELTIEPSLTTGTFTEPAKRGTRRLALVEGRLDSFGTYSARLQYSLATEGEQTFDQLISLQRAEDGSLQCELSESPEENPILERRLNRQPYPKASFSARGTLRAER